MRNSTLIIFVLLIVIAILGWLLAVKPAEAPVVPGTETNNGAPAPAPTPSLTHSPAPLHTRVSVTYPKPNASVPKKFTIKGYAPGNWFFEASAPYMVTTEDGSKVAQGTLQTIGDWMTTELVDFKADVSINPAYSGPATLVLLKDNPSGLPENDDSLEISITIK